LKSVCFTCLHSCWTSVGGD